MLRQILVTAGVFLFLTVADADFKSFSEKAMRGDRHDVDCSPSSCVITLDNVPWGQTLEYTINVPGHVVDVMKIGVISSSGSSTVQIIGDTCSNQTLPPGGACDFTIKYTPVAPGKATKTFTIPWRVLLDEYFDPPYSDGSFSHFVNVESVEQPPLDPDDECGSIIGVTGRTLGEIIPIVGTPFYLAYKSSYTDDYLSPFPSLGRKSFFNPNLWTISAQHYYDSAMNKLYLGTGQTLKKAAAPSAGSEEAVISEDGTEIYYFDINGKHLRTVSSLTGLTLLSFSYDAFGLTTIEDQFGNQTNLMRNSSGDLISIISPFGQTTSLTTNTNDQLLTVTNPASETYTLTYKSGTDLLETFSKPGGEISTFSYDANGRLIEDLGHGGNKWTLSMTGTEASGTITKTSQMGRATTYAKSTDVYGNYTRLKINPDGSYSNNFEEINGNFGVSSHLESTRMSMCPSSSPICASQTRLHFYKPFYCCCYLRQSRLALWRKNAFNR